jgi:hypothetical protein
MNNDTDTNKHSIGALLKAVPWYYGVLACVPLLGIFAGGLIGGMLGGACFYLILFIARREMPTVLKLASIGGIYCVATVLYLVIVVGITMFMNGAA